MVGLSDAMQRGTITPQDVTSACARGDDGIADVIAANRAPMYRPGMRNLHLGALVSHFTGDCRPQQFLPWVRMLASTGDLTTGGLSRLAAPSRSINDLYLVVGGAWERFKRRTIAGAGLPPVFGGSFHTFDVRPQPLEDLRARSLGWRPSQDSANEGDENPVFHLVDSATRHSALRAEGENYRALGGALSELSRRMILPIISPPELISDDVYGHFEEMISDLEKITTWDKAGKPSYPIDEAYNLLEYFGYADEESNDSLLSNALEPHLVWRKWTKQNPIYKPDTQAARTWRMQCKDRRMKALFDDINQCIAVLHDAPRFKPCYDLYFDDCDPMIAHLVPVGIGIDDWISDYINADYQNGSDVMMKWQVKANTSQLVRAATRAVVEVAITNHIVSRVVDLD